MKKPSDMSPEARERHEKHVSEVKSASKNKQPDERDVGKLITHINGKKITTVTSANKAEHDKKFMEKQSGKSESPSNSGELADQAYALSAKKFPSGDAMKAHAVAAESYLKEKQHELATRHRELSHSHFLGLAKQDQSDDGEFHVYHKETNKHQGTYKSNKEASSFKNKLNENKPDEYHIITTPKND